MPIVKDKQPIPEGSSTKKTDQSDITSIVFDDAFFEEIAKQDFFKEKRERVTKILEQVDWSGFNEKHKQ
jgi:hypothetical protein